MSAKTVIDEHDNRLSVITAIGVAVRALVPDESTEDMIPSNDAGAEKALYARAFQAWLEGRIEGNAEDIFETVQEVLESSAA